jgi:calcineurin-like phosphoesterase family protein
MSNKYIISDLHLGHENIIKYSQGLRSGTNSEEHDEWIIKQWNSIVKKGDLTYVLGDVAMDKKSLHKVKRLNGSKILIRGNHDIEPCKLYLEYFHQVYGLWRYRGVFWMSHAPIHPFSLRGLFNLHGHVHQNELDVEKTFGIPQSLDDLYSKYKSIVELNRLALK